MDAFSPPISLAGVSQETEPTYGELQRLLRDTPSSQSSKSLVERLQSEFAFNQDSLKQR